MRNNHTPEIRFPGFTGDWEQRELHSIVDRLKSYSLSRNVETSEYTGYKYIHYGDIHTKVADVIDESSNLPNIKTGNYELLEKGDLVLADASEDYQGIATPAVIMINPPYKLVSGLHTIALRPIQADPLFLYFLIHSPTFRRYGYKTGTGMKVFGISAKNVLKFEGMFPLLEEQIQIGQFLNKLDDIISIHEQELTILKQTKQGFLQKMFPKEGESVPEIRFPGFTGVWEQRNILEVSKVFIGLVTTMTKNYRESGGTLLIRNSDIKENRFEFSNNLIYLDESFAEQNHTRRLIIGDVVTVHTGDIGTSAVITERENGSIGFATINSRPNPNLLDSNYLATFFNTERHKNYAIKMSTGDGRSNYNLKDFNKLTVPLPSIEEQKKIGLFFKYFDKTIALQQKELELLQETKRAFLQKMFV